MKQTSASKLGVFRECPRCFWLQENSGIKRPRGIFPSLPGGMDRVFKDWYDQHRAVSSLPSEVSNFLPEKSVLFADQEKLQKYRNWRSGIKFVIEDVTVWCVIDDLLRNEDETVSPFDYKTRGSAPKADAPDYYGYQLDLYALALQSESYKLNGKGYLAYYWPKAIESIDDSAQVTFDCQIEEKTVSKDRAIELIVKAKACADQKEAPPGAATCEYCQFVEARKR